MEILKLNYWDPGISYSFSLFPLLCTHLVTLLVKGMKYVLGEIRSMLQEHGRLDVNNPMNDMTLYPAGAYTRLEYLLLRLELLWCVSSQNYLIIMVLIRPQ
jgi:hypothetical protein